MNRQRKERHLQKTCPGRNPTSETSPRSHLEDYHLNNPANLQIKITGFVQGPAVLARESLAIDSTLEGRQQQQHCNMRIGTAAHSAGPSAHVYTQLVDQVKVLAADI